MTIGANGDWIEDIVPLVDGMVTIQPTEFTPKGAAKDIEWHYEVNGELRKVPGRMSRGTLAGGGAIRGLFYWFRKTDNNLQVVHTTNRMFSSSDFITFTERATVLAGTKRDFISYAPVNPDDFLLCADGVDVPKVFTGEHYTNLTLPTDVTNARFVFHIDNRTVLVKVLELGVWQNVQYNYSVQGDYNNWTTVDGAGAGQYTEGGGTIMAAVMFSDSIVLFKRHCVGVLHPTGNEAVPFRLEHKAEVPGTIYPGSVQVTPRGIIYLAYDGLRLFDLQSSSPIAPNVMLDITAIAADQANAVTSTWDLRLRRYMLGVPTSGQVDNNRVWEVHVETQGSKLFKRSQSVAQFGFFYRTAPITFATLPITFQQAPFSFDDPLVLGSYPVLVSGDYNGEIFEHEVTTDDDGVAIQSFIEIGPFPKDPDISMLIDKRCTEMRMRARKSANTSLTVKVRATDKDVWTTLPVVPNLANQPDGDTYIIPVDMTGEQFNLRLENGQQFGWPRIYYMGLVGTSTGRPRRR